METKDFLFKAPKACKIVSLGPRNAFQQADLLLNRPV